MTLTPQQRLAIYESAKRLVVLEEVFVCPVLLALGSIFEKGLKIKNDFPEFFAQRPEGLDNPGGIWYDWNDTASRLAALDRAIELVKEKL